MEERSFKQELTAKWTLTESVRTAIIAALYIGLTMILAPLAYGIFQIRISETLGMLPYDRKYGGRAAAIGVVGGGTIIGLLSPHGVVDLILGITSGIICLGFVWWAGIFFKGNDKGKIIAGVIFSLVTTFFIGYLMLHIVFQAPLWEAIFGVLIGELITVVGLGFGLLKGLEATYRRKKK